MRKLFFMPLICTLALAAGCGDDGTTGTNSNSTPTDASQDAGPQPDVADATDDVGDAPEPDATADATGDTTDDAADGSSSYPDDIGFEEYQDALLSASIDVACTGAWQCASPMADSTPIARRFDSAQDCRDELETSPIIRAPIDQDTSEIAGLIADGRIIYDSQAAADCLNGLAGLSTQAICHNELDDAFTACNEGILTGTIGDGAACTLSDECAGEAYCSSGTCTLSDCDGTVCDDSEYCHRSANGSESCEPRKTEGSQCDGYNQCGEGLSCMTLDSEDTGVCLAPGSRDRGEACSSATFCGGTDMCVDETCQEFEFVQQGGACEAADFCEPGTICQLASADAVVGSCQPPADVGDACSETEVCYFPMHCDGATDSQLGSCARPKPNGASCDRRDECESGLCVNDTCGDS